MKPNKPKTKPRDLDDVQGTAPSFAPPFKRNVLVVNYGPTRSTSQKRAPRPLNSDQDAAIKKVLQWLLDTEDKNVRKTRSFFAFQGYAGTGKTWSLRALLDILNESVLDRSSPYFTITAKPVFTAPTNKAAKVCQNSIGSDASTIYSFLGLKMAPGEDDKMVLQRSEGNDYVPSTTLLVIDESSMLNEEICKHIKSLVETYAFRVLLIGDPAQLPPVGEKETPAWSYAQEEDYVLLTKVERNGNDLLDVATRVREAMFSSNRREVVLKHQADREACEGVFKFKNKALFVQRLRERFAEPDVNLGEIKVLAWRNAVVDHYNHIIREVLGFSGDFMVGDHILLADALTVEEYNSLSRRREKCVIAHVDDEFTIEEILESEISSLRSDFPEIMNATGGYNIPAWRLRLRNEFQEVEILRPKDPAEFDKKLSEFADFARANRGNRSYSKAWPAFWELKGRATSFRFGYAMTSHRAQGSTYDECWLDQKDVLSNPVLDEKLRCLYVDVTRPRLRLFTY